jgi:hypothetical protein
LYPQWKRVGSITVTVSGKTRIEDPEVRTHPPALPKKHHNDADQNMHQSASNSERFTVSEIVTEEFREGSGLREAEAAEQSRMTR